MGEQNVSDGMNEQDLRTFVRKLLDDLRALELMLERDMFESGIRRIGAEQEMFIVDDAGRPATMALELLEDLDSATFTNELALFNLEANLMPRVFEGRCLREMEAEVTRAVATARGVAQAHGADVVLTGILPTLEQADLTLDAMTPVPRYYELNRTLTRLRGGAFQTYIKGLDELQFTHDNILLEACNTSFQVHFQVSAGEFAPLYNLAQAITGPVLAAAVNSPVLLGHRLWQETRIALFQQSIDSRSSTMAKRGRRTRVTFGERWVDESVIDLFREDIARMRVVLGAPVDEDALAMVEGGEAPKLKALMLHNGTVYRWNRPCYGVHRGVPHLRIENRVIPSGPTPLDEVANAALFFGLMSALALDVPDVRERMAFDDAKGNFIRAARHGLKAQFTWFDGKEYTAQDLLLAELLPLARRGLEDKGVAVEDVDRYIGVLEERVQGGQTGATWAMRSLGAMHGRATRSERAQALVAASLVNQRGGEPVSRWPLAKLTSAPVWQGYAYVGQVMTTDLVTVRPDDAVDLVAKMMDWERIRHVPVEDDEGHLVGLVTHRSLFRLIGRTSDQPVPIRDIMRSDLLTLKPDTPTVDAIRLMRERRVGCMPIVEEGKLVGLLTESDLLTVAAGLLEEQLSKAKRAAHRPKPSSPVADADVAVVTTQPAAEVGGATPTEGHAAAEAS